MMSIQDLGSKESLGVKLKYDICVELCFMLWFESKLYFCSITKSLSQVRFESDVPRNRVSKNHFLKSVLKGNCTKVHCGNLYSYFQSHE